MKVTKRNGTSESFDISKVKKAILWACEPYNVDSDKLIRNSSYNYYEGINTKDIQQTVIDEAKSLISAEEPEWVWVAGRLLWQQLSKETVKRRNYSYARNTFRNHITEHLLMDLYDKDIFDKFSIADVDYLSNFLQYKNDTTYSYTSLIKLQRYFVGDELPQEMFMVLAMCLHSDMPFDSEENKKLRLHKITVTYNALSNRLLSLATPIMLNLRKPGTNLASCFILDIDDSLDSITHSWEQIGKISKGSGGVGANISSIRATGATVNGRENASGGVLPWLKVINDIALAVNQGGLRAGAVTTALAVWHYDILDFLDCQSNVGEIRKKSHDIFPAVTINDLFMEYALADEDWYLFDPHEASIQLFGTKLSDLYGLEFNKAYKTLVNKAKNNELKIVNKIKAKELLTKILKTILSKGKPYIFFTDTVNNVNPNEGIIKNANLCCESFSSFTTDMSHCCNLLSLNLAEVEYDEEIEFLTKLGIELLDNIIELATPPTEESKLHNEYYRTLGLGVMGLADHLAYKCIKYDDSEESMSYISSLFEKIAYHSFAKTIELGKERGNCPSHASSKLAKGMILGKIFNGDEYVEIEDLLDNGFTRIEIETIANDSELKQLLFNN